MQANGLTFQDGLTFLQENDWQNFHIRITIDMRCATGLPALASISESSLNFSDTGL